MNTTEIIVLILGTICLIYLSWTISLKKKRYHGIYRFFVFEGIFVIVLLNYPYWFKDPFSLIQIVSWILLLSSAIIAFLGFYLLYTKGEPEGQLENTSNLITTGIYKYLRHPVYLSLIPGVLGALLKGFDYLQVILTVVVLISLVITAKVEEKEMIEKFGTEYLDYMKKTKMFIPFVF
jgi:protein-S-isoprenylcysteine O-methyltransferase Ste14